MSNLSTKWSYIDGVLDIFGAKGTKVGDDAYLGTSLGQMVHTQPHGLYGQMSQALAMICDRYGADRIEYMGVNEYLALQLYFENLLRMEDLGADTTPDDHASITTSITFCRVERKLIIRKFPFAALGFYDHTGKQLV